MTYVRTLNFATIINCWLLFSHYLVLLHLIVVLTFNSTCLSFPLGLGAHGSSSHLLFLPRQLGRCLCLAFGTRGDDSRFQGWFATGRSVPRALTFTQRRCSSPRVAFVSLGGCFFEVSIPLWDLKITTSIRMSPLIFHELHSKGLCRPVIGKLFQIRSLFTSLMEHKVCLDSIQMCTFTHRLIQLCLCRSWDICPWQFPVQLPTKILHKMLNLCELHSDGKAHVWTYPNCVIFVFVIRQTHSLLYAHSSAWVSNLWC